MEDMILKNEAILVDMFIGVDGQKNIVFYDQKKHLKYQGLLNEPELRVIDEFNNLNKLENRCIVHDNAKDFASFDEKIKKFGATIIRSTSKHILNRVERLCRRLK